MMRSKITSSVINKKISPNKKSKISSSVINKTISPIKKSKISSSTIVKTISPNKKSTSITTKIEQLGKKIKIKQEEQDKTIDNIKNIFESDQTLSKLELQLKSAYEKYMNRKKEIVESKQFKEEQEKLIQINKEMNSILSMALQHFTSEKQEIINNSKLSNQEKQEAIQKLYESLCKNLFTEEESAIFTQLLFGMNQHQGSFPICFISTNGLTNPMPIMMLEDSSSK